MSTNSAPEVSVTSAREAIKAIGAGQVPGASATMVDECARIGAFMDKHPLVGGAIQSLLLHRYMRDTGATAVDWKAFLAWLVANAPAIIQVIMTILGFFGV